MEDRETLRKGTGSPAEYLPRFGLRGFRPGQLEVIQAVLAGKDCLCIMPTGGGKSLCYQLPSLMLGGTTLVVSPLIALMKDQVDSLRAKGIRASFVNSSLSVSDQNQRLHALARREFDLLYVAPERFRSRFFLEAIREAQVTMLAVDEAHCISEWGHDFRHDYSRLGEYRARLGNPQTIALTATATEEVRSDITAQLRLRQPTTLVAGFSRPNLRLTVQYCDDSTDKQILLARFLRRNLGHGIIYAATRKACASLVEEVSRVAGRSAVLYHGGLDPDRRRKAQDDFMHGDAEIAVATNAFGMGIDKADVRFVVHYNFPGSVEAYYQEAGRAGRDGEPAECLLLYAPKDRWIQEFFIESAYPDPMTVLQVYEFLKNNPNDPVEMTQQEIRDHLRLKISNEGVGTCERLLEKAGALERLEPKRNLALVRILSDLPTLVELLPKHAKAQRQVLRLAEQAVGDLRGEDVYFSPEAWARKLGTGTASIARTLRELTKLEAFDYVPPFRGRAVRVLDRNRPFSDIEIDFEGLERRRQADYKKLARITQFCQTSNCRQRYILDYFGDPAARLCDNCDNCRPSAKQDANTTDLAACTDVARVQLSDEPGVHRVVRIALSAVARAKERIGKNLVSAMLQGSQAVKVQKLNLHELSTFGMLSHLTQADVTQLLDACLEQGWLEQYEIDRFRPVLRLSDSGRQVMREEQPADHCVYLPAPVIAKILAKELARHAAAPPQLGSATTSSGKLQSQPGSPPNADPSELPTVNEPFYWTWRVLAAGLSIDETAAARGLDQQDVLEHALEAVDRGYPLNLSQLLPDEEREILKKLAENEAAAQLRSDNKPRPISPKMLLFLKSQTQDKGPARY